MWITVFTFLLLYVQSVEVAAEDCNPHRHCLTCLVGLPYHCTSCRKGSHLQRGGAYNSCEACGVPCLECTNKYRCDRCVIGYYGEKCRDVCGKGCIDSFCDIQLGSCVCKKNFAGAKCDRCTNGKYGYELSHCELTCPPNCKACVSNTTTCTQCNDGYYGLTCDRMCPRGCYVGACSQSTGICYGNTCKANFYGPSCDKCSTGWHGGACASLCPGNCISCLSETKCEICKEGHWGSACQNNCSHGCLDGLCTKESGICDQCKHGFTGETCTICIAGLHGVFCNMNETLIENSASAILLHVDELYMQLSLVALLFYIKALISSE